MIATLFLWHWPYWAESISWLWRNPNSYNFSSSEWGGAIFRAIEVGGLYLLLKPLRAKINHHLECSVEGCTNIGHPIPHTPYRACHIAGHHPGATHKPNEPITAQHIREAHERTNPREREQR